MRKEETQVGNKRREKKKTGEKKQMKFGSSLSALPNLCLFFFCLFVCFIFYLKQTASTVSNGHIKRLYVCVCVCISRVFVRKCPCFRYKLSHEKKMEAMERAREWSENGHRKIRPHRIKVSFKYSESKDRTKKKSCGTNTASTPSVVVVIDVSIDILGKLNERGVKKIRKQKRKKGLPRVTHILRG